jgi:hypothetical protein
MCFGEDFLYVVKRTHQLDPADENKQVSDPASAFART